MGALRGASNWALGGVKDEGMFHLLVAEADSVDQPNELVGTGLQPHLGGGVVGVGHHFVIESSVTCYYNKYHITLPCFTTSSQLLVISLFWRDLAIGSHFRHFRRFNSRDLFGILFIKVIMGITKVDNRWV